LNGIATKITKLQ